MTWGEGLLDPTAALLAQFVALVQESNRVVGAYNRLSSVRPAMPGI